MRKSGCSNRNIRSYMEMVVLGSSDKNKNLNERLRNGAGVGSVVTVGDDAGLLSTWPPKHYTCSFCKRSFKSAQALGGHMNVHRRARALLRSQSISPIPSPPSSISPWHPTNSITTHPPENDEILIPNPNIKWPLSTPHHTRNPYLRCDLPAINITSSSTLRHKNPPLAAATAYKHSSGSWYPHAEPMNEIKAKKNCIIRAEDKLNGILLSWNYTHHDDAFVTLRLGNGLITSNSTDQQDMDLELRL